MALLTLACNHPQEEEESVTVLLNNQDICISWIFMSKDLNAVVLPYPLLHLKYQWPAQNKWKNTFNCLDHRICGKGEVNGSSSLKIPKTREVLASLRGILSCMHSYIQAQLYLPSFHAPPAQLGQLCSVLSTMEHQECHQSVPRGHCMHYLGGSLSSFWIGH